MIKEIKWLIYKDLQIDWRSRYPVAGMLLYISSLIVTCYLSFTGFIADEAWNALFWLILLFISVNAVAKSFVQEENRSLYYFYLVSPVALIWGKLIYYAIYQLLLVMVAFVIFTLFLGMPPFDLGLFSLNVLVGSIGLSSAFTMIAAIAAKTNNQSMMMAILGFPVIIPLLMLAISNSQIIVLGGSWNDIIQNFITLLSVNVIIIALTFILFPYIWKS